MKVIVSKKNTFIYLIKGLFCFLFGVWLISSLGYENEFLPVFGKLIGLGIVICGIFFMVQFVQLSQPYDYEIAIKDNYLIFNDEKFLLQQSYLTIEFLRKEPIMRVTLRVENKNGTQIVFKNLVFYDTEFKALLELIKPYLKNETLIEKIEEKNETLRLFKNGFALNNREFYYNEVKDIQTTIIDGGTYYLDYKIVLKNGEIIEKRLINGSSEYAKAIYTKLKLQNKTIPYCQENKMVSGYVILGLDILTAILIYFNDVFWMLGGMMFLVTTFYLSSNSSYEVELCKKVRELFQNETK